MVFVIVYVERGNQHPPPPPPTLPLLSSIESYQCVHDVCVCGGGGGGGGGGTLPAVPDQGISVCV